MKINVLSYFLDRIVWKYKKYIILTVGIKHSVGIPGGINYLTIAYAIKLVIFYISVTVYTALLTV